MPIQLSKADRKLMMIAGAIFVLMIVAALLLVTPPESQSETPTTYSTASGGAKAAYLLLKASGYKVERWEESPTELPDPNGKTLVLAEPSAAPTVEEREDLHRFVERGGKIIASGISVGFFLPENGTVQDETEEEAWKRMSAQSPSSITRAAPRITMAPQAYWQSSTFAVPLYGHDQYATVVMYKYGKGEVLWWAAPTPLTNAGIKEPGNMEFVLACMGKPGESQILWDEYYHGYRRSLTGSISRTPAKWIFAQLALFGLIVVLTYSRRSMPIVVPPREVRLSPLEFVRTLGTLYEQANAASIAVDIYYHRFRYWLTRRLGLSASVPVQELENAIRERWIVKDADLSAVLRACESAPYDTNMKPEEALKLFRTLHDYEARFELFSSKEKH